MLTRITLAVDKPALRKKLRGLLTHPDVILHTPRGKSRLWERITTRPADVLVVAESVIPRPAADGIAFVQSLPDAPAVVVIRAEDDPEERARLLAAGCEAVLTSSLSTDAFEAVLGAILEKRTEETERAFVGARAMAEARLSDFVSRSPSMQAFMGLVHRVVPSDVSLLLLGETGVGKERLARAIHAEGTRSGGPFIAVNCGALPESLLESELFGHEKGAFTGASRSRRGLFELAHRGTVFLDEIGEMPFALQVRLLRVLQDREIQPLGSERTLKVNVRVMAASNRDLEAEVEARRFRKDLYYRLSVVTLTVPPLKERREDIPELVQSYLSYLQPRTGCQIDGLDDRAMEALARYSWPGNVRELINVIERAMLLCDGREISLNDLPETIREGRAADASPSSLEIAQEADVATEALLEKPLKDARRKLLGRFERAYLTGLLAATGGRVGETARRAGITPRSLYDKMKRHGLCKEDFQPPKGSR